MSDPEYMFDLSTFDNAQLAALVALQMRYNESHDMFTPEELSRLNFVKWLVDSGRMSEWISGTTGAA